MKSYTKPSLKHKNKQAGQPIQLRLRTDLRAGTSYEQAQKNRDPDSPNSLYFDNE